jgi:hypothetical protein
VFSTRDVKAALSGCVTRVQIFFQYLFDTGGW